MRRGQPSREFVQCNGDLDGQTDASLRPSPGENLPTIFGAHAFAKPMVSFSFQVRGLSKRR